MITTSNYNPAPWVGHPQLYLNNRAPRAPPGFTYCIYRVREVDVEARATSQRQRSLRLRPPPRLKP